MCGSGQKHTSTITDWIDLFTEHSKANRRKRKRRLEDNTGEEREERITGEKGRTKTLKKAKLLIEVFY